VISLIEHHELKTPTVQLALMVACISAAASSSSKVQTSVGRLLKKFQNHGVGFFFIFFHKFGRWLGYQRSFGNNQWLCIKVIFKYPMYNRQYPINRRLVSFFRLFSIPLILQD